MDSTAAPTEEVTATALDGASVLTDMSMWSLFWHAGTIVQLVIIGLLVASVMSWGIIFEKWSRFKSTRYKSDRFEANFWSGTPLDQLFEKYKKAKTVHPLAAIFFIFWLFFFLLWLFFLFLFFSRLWFFLFWGRLNIGFCTNRHKVNHNCLILLNNIILRTHIQAAHCKQQHNYTVKDKRFCPILIHLAVRYTKQNFIQDELLGYLR